MSLHRVAGRLTLVLAAATISLPTVVRAQEYGSIRVNIKGGEGAQIGHPVMVSCIQDGTVFYQSETQVGYAATCQVGGENQISVGTYDIRAEGAGLATEVKQGVLVTAGNSTNLTFNMKAGEGLNLVEYSTGGLAREEVAVRLRDLESTVSSLPKFEAISDDLLEQIANSEEIKERWASCDVCTSSTPGICYETDTEQCIVLRKQGKLCQIACVDIVRSGKQD